MRMTSASEFANEDTGQPGVCAGCLLPLLPGEGICNHRGVGMHVDCYEAEKEEADDRRAEMRADDARERAMRGSE